MCLICGIIIGIQIGISLHKDDAVKSGHGMYNAMTGLFEWKEIDKKEEES
jgi:hypothetical protein